MEGREKEKQNIGYFKIKIIGPNTKEVDKLQFLGNYILHSF